MQTSQLAVGLFLAALIALLAHRAGALTPSGAGATVFIGTLTFGVGGLTPALLLILFFVSSSVLSIFSAGKKEALAAYSSKGGRRDAGQVLANGTAAALAAVAYGLTGDHLWLAGVAGALATATADTWGTEIGVLSRQSPRRITNGARVPPGTSGGITLLGTSNGIAGAALIGLSGFALEGAPGLMVTTCIAGTIGMLVDSLLGSTVQVIYRCPACEKETEQHPRHHCGNGTGYLRGISWFDNDVVNLLSTFIGAGLGIGLWTLFGA
jgi:uncharacterized protein (TIGR00297 family)